MMCCKLTDGTSILLITLAILLSLGLIARGFKTWLDYRYLSSNLKLEVLDDTHVKISWRGKNPIYVDKVLLEVPVGKGKKPLRYDEVKVRTTLKRGEEVVITLNKSLEMFKQLVSTIRRTSYIIVSTSLGVSYAYV